MTRAPSLAHAVPWHSERYPTPADLVDMALGQDRRWLARMRRDAYRRQRRARA